MRPVQPCPDGKAVMAVADDEKTKTKILPLPLPKKKHDDDEKTKKALPFSKKKAKETAAWD